ncbi:DUF624 domain-containing protein [Fusibacter ferrireducens]|uniref:YesL family protein n=1 Tax=Fusibacter ferrireducens TaxID=2785058 RepID=A0ABR9ZW58_9FIRM|nr:YesL family protein [Fusibacter ferrireducens]MBF4693859.1 YesL family protein [Fusibacter ferrireducens]
MKLFDIDSPFSQIMTLLYELILLNIYFLATVFLTLGFGTGVAITAMIYAIYHGLRREEGSVRQLYFKSLKMNFKQVTLYWVGIMVIASISYFNLLNIELLRQLSFIFVVFQYILIYELIVVSLYYFGIQSKLTLNNKEAIKSAFIMAHKHALTSISMIFTLLLLYILGRYVSSFFILIMFSAWAYILERVILEHIIIGKYVSDEVRAELKIEK